MSGIECGDKRGKNQSSPESVNESDHVQMAADCKKMVEKCDSVNNKRKHVSEIVCGLEIKGDAGSDGVFAGSTSIILCCEYQCV